MDGTDISPREFSKEILKSIVLQLECPNVVQSDSELLYLDISKAALALGNIHREKIINTLTYLNRNKILETENSDYFELFFEEFAARFFRIVEGEILPTYFHVAFLTYIGLLGIMAHHCVMKQMDIQFQLEADVKMLKRTHLKDAKCWKLLKFVAKQCNLRHCTQVK